MKQHLVLISKWTCTCLVSALCFGTISVKVADASIPPVTSGLITALDGSDVTTTGANVTSWNDQSGSANHAVQATADNQPLLVASATPTGTSAISFDGADDFLDILANASDYDATAFTWYVVRQSNSTDNARLFNTAYADIDSVISGDQYSGQAWASLAGTTNRHRAIARDISNGFNSANVAGTNTTDFFVTGAIWNGLSSVDNLTAILLNGPDSRVVESASIIDNAEPSGHLRTRVGAGIDHNELSKIEDNANEFDGQIAEILVYDRVLSAAEQTMVEDYLYDKHIGPGPSSFSWNSANSGVWGNKNNWTDTFFGPPTNNNVGVSLGDAIGAASRTVALDNATTVNSVAFDNTMGGSYVVAGSETLTLAESDSFTAPTISVAEGSHQFQAPVALANDTSVSVTSGSLDFNNEIDLGGNTMTVSGNVNINHSVVGGGMINSSGTLGTAGSTSFTADLTSTDTLLIDLGDNNIDFFDITGSATLSGTLDIVLEAGFVPTGSYTILSASSSLNAAGLSLDAGDEAMFDLLIQGNDLVLSVASATEDADFDGDGDVDGSDFLAWQTGFGTDSGASLSDGDANADGAVNAADFNIWTSQFGTTSGNGSLAGVAVPEPSSILLLLLACFGLLIHRAKKASLLGALALLIVLGLNTRSNADLIGYWPLDEPAGSSAVIGEDGNGDTIPSNGTVVNEVNTGVGAVVGTGYDFAQDTSSDYVDFSFGKDILTGDATISAFVKAESFNPSGGAASRNGIVWSDGNVFGLATSAGRPFLIHRTTDGAAVDPVLTYNYTTAPDAMSLNEFHHIAGVRDSISGNVMLYLDGVLVKTEFETTDQVLTGNLRFGYGGSSSGARNWDGIIDDIGVWNEVVPSKEIAAIAGLGLHTGVALNDLAIEDVLLLNTVGQTADAGEVTWTYTDTFAPDVNSETLTAGMNYLGTDGKLYIILEDSGGFKGVSGNAPTAFEWLSADSGSWGNSLHWTGSSFGPPNTSQQTTLFGDAIGSETKTVFLDEAVTINAISFNNSMGGSYNISGALGVTLAADGATSPTISNIQGNHQFQTTLTLASDASIDVASGSLDFNNQIDLGGNTLTLSGNVNINHSVVGGGTVVVSGAGSLSGGGSFATDFVSEGTLVVNLGEGYADYFDISGNATLSGTLDVILGEGFIPSGSYTILTSGGILEADGLSLEASDNAFFDLVVDGNSLILNVLSEDAGDFDGDGDIDGSDFLAWQTGFGSGSTAAAGDANGDGVVDGKDLNIWIARYGNSNGNGGGSLAGGAVPEPSSVALLLAAFLGVCGVLRFRSR